MLLGWQRKPIGRARWHAAILHLNKIPFYVSHLQEKKKMDDLVLAVER